MIRVLDLFCGGGGSSWGAAAAGAEIACGVDFSSVAIAAFRKNFPHAKAVHLEMNPHTVPQDLGEIGPIDLLLGSPECTHHTCARGSRPQDEASKRTAFYVPNFARLLRPQPRWVVIENVVHMRGWSGYQPLISQLRDLGYNTQAYVLDASRFGVPQKRRRVFIAGDLEAKPPAKIRQRPGPTPCAKSILAAEDHAHRSRPLNTPTRAPATLQRADRAIKELGTGQPFLIVYYGSDGSGGWQPLDRPLRTITTLDRFGLVTWRDEVPFLRMLQVDELMAAMGFSLGFTLDGIGHRRDRIRLLGNGVCPPVMTALVRELTVGTPKAASAAVSAIAPRLRTH